MIANVNFSKQNLISLIVGIILGAVGVTAIRFAFVKDDHVHYHANFALYVNGKRDEFKDSSFYEEVAACDIHDADNVKAHVHMHDNNNALVHVHASGITWSDFFNNLGYTLSDKLVKTDRGVYIDGENSNHLAFMLNGQKVTSLANKVIKSEDVLLINYGQDDNKTLTNRYDAIPRDAHMANTTTDPASCSGSEPLTFTTRLRKSFGF
ncbi:MAG TPA: hypothetical protein VLG25_00940 [Patescibacteria group bacterium]|nr:hypothetical protein [Patescibacteria group bacterium]